MRKDLIIVERTINDNGEVTNYRVQDKLILCRDCKHMQLNFEGVPECKNWKQTTYTFTGYCHKAEVKE